MSSICWCDGPSCKPPEKGVLVCFFPLAIVQFLKSVILNPKLCAANAGEESKVTSFLHLFLSAQKFCLALISRVYLLFVFFSNTNFPRSKSGQKQGFLGYELGSNWKELPVMALSSR